MQGGRLVVNADVSNTAFWRPGDLAPLCIELAAPTPEKSICAAIQKPGGLATKMYKNVQRLRKLRVNVKYANISDRIKNKTFIIADILGTNARHTYFENVVDGKLVEISVFDYFLNHYKHRLTEAHLPVVKMTRGQLYPMELCIVQKGQRYPYKLNEFQTAQMIRFAVTKPDIRRQAIEKGLAALNWSADPYHKGYGLKINPQMIETKARILPPPAVEFHAGKVEKPGTSGRWRVDGKQFIRPNHEPLTRWGIGVFNNWAADPRTRVTEVEVKRFMVEFVRLYKGYGGKVANNQPPIMFIDDIKKCTEELWNKCTVNNQPPQLFVFVVNAKMTMHYNRVKKSADCRFGVVSQVMQSMHVKKINAQYISNVLLKVNAKLGGFNFRANPNPTVTSTATKLDPVKLVPEDTIIIGADVSHAGAGSLQPSMAAMTVSMDNQACRFAAACQTNGNHVEMISTWNIYDMLRPLFLEWIATVGKGKLPRNVMYFRDGVSEGQYQHVLQLEVRDIKQLLRDIDQQHGKLSDQIKFAVVIASKRHHIRFFPKPGTNTGDKNGNALPGTIVERDVTHPTEYDFYLAAHYAIQGTARPVHYHVLVNEVGGTPDVLVKMIYNLSYQYARSTTPVSIFPAIYYAHLASKRATAHDRKEVDEDFKYTSKDLSDLWKLEQARSMCDRTGKIMTQAAIARLAQLTRAEFPTLLYMPEAGPDKNRIRYSMWYI
jgi:eukaryotic translation initiation factor 2C